MFIRKRQGIKNHVSSKPTQVYVILTTQGYSLSLSVTYTDTCKTYALECTLRIYTSTRVYILKTLVCCDVIPLFQQPNISPVTVRF